MMLTRRGRGWWATGVAVACVLLTEAAARADDCDDVPCSRSWTSYHPHLRFAVGAIGDILVRTAGQGRHPASDFGGGGGLQLQLGVQASRLFALVYQGFWMLGSFQPNEGQPYSSAGFVFNELMLDFTLPRDPKTGVGLQLGVAPSLDLFCTQGACWSLPGADARLTMVFGSHYPSWDWMTRPRPVRQAAFVVGLDYHPSFAANTTLTTSALINSVMLSLGFELF